MTFVGKFFSFLALSMFVSMQVCCVSKQNLPINGYKRAAYNQVALLEIEFEIVNEETKEVSKPSISATGFAVDKNLIATAGHFCIGAMRIAIRSNDVHTAITFVDKDEELKTMTDFKIVALDAKNDLCLIEKPRHGLKVVSFADGSLLKIRDEIFTVGAPSGTFPIQTSGYVSLPSIFSTQEELNGKIMASLPIYRGNSGSPVFNTKGEVIGVVVMRRYALSFYCFSNSCEILKDVNYRI